MFALFIALSLPVFAGPHGQRGEGPPGHGKRAHEVEAQVLELAEEDAELAAELEALKAEDPRLYREAVLRTYRERIHERDPELQKLHAEEKALRSQMRVHMLELEELEGRERDQKVDEITALAGEIFDLRTQAHQAQVQRLEERLETAKAELAEREADREALIEAWVAEETAE